MIDVSASETDGAMFSPIVIAARLRVHAQYPARSAVLCFLRSGQDEVARRIRLDSARSRSMLSAGTALRMQEDNDMLVSRYARA